MKLPLIFVLLVLAGMLLLAAACTRQPAPASPPAAPDFVAADPADALPQFVVAERTAANQRDLATLAALWSPDARIVDGRGTPAPGDDYVWRGRADILDRYVVAVFPAPPPLLDAPPAGAVQVEGATATAQFGHDRWTFVRRDGRWWIQELSY